MNEARRRFQRGVGFYRDADYNSALVEFQEAYRIAPNFRILYNLGQTRAELHDYAGATKSFRAYFAEGGSQIAAPRRAEVEGELRALAAHVAQVDLDVNVEGATITFEGARRLDVGTSPLVEPVLLDAGVWTVEAVKEGYVKATAEVAVAGGEHKRVALVLSPPQEAPKAPPPPSVAPVTAPAPATLPPARETAAEPPQRPSMAPVWIGAGTTLAFAGAAGLTGALALHAKSNYDAQVATFGVAHSDVVGARDTVHTFALLTDVLGGAAIASATVTAVLWLTRRSPSAKQSAWAFEVTGQGVRATATWP